jgi:hypothetical protein
MRSWNRRGFELRLFCFLMVATGGCLKLTLRSFGLLRTPQDDNLKEWKIKSPPAMVVGGRELMIGAAPAKRRLLELAEWPPVSAR